MVVDVATAYRRRVRLESISFHFNALNLLYNSMSTFEDSPLAVETPAIPAHSTNSQANTAHHMGAAALGVVGITLTRRRYVTR